LRVAAVQAESAFGDLHANVATAVGAVARAAAVGARVVVLPELFLTGYDPQGWSPQTCVTPADPCLAPLAEVARAHETVVVVGAALVGPTGRPTLSLLVFDASGEVHQAYDKQHLTEEEQQFFAPGLGGASLLVDGWELGLGICYDGCFPEHAMAAARDGASAYLCPSAYYVGSEHRRDLYYAARALDNGIYVVFAGLTGTCGGHRFNGGSAIYDPEGRPLDRADDPVDHPADDRAGDDGDDHIDDRAHGRPAMAVADLDAAEVARVQVMNPMGRDRRELGSRVRLVL
jgi:predicted amidohydrolase